MQSQMYIQIKGSLLSSLLSPTHKERELKNTHTEPTRMLMQTESFKMPKPTKHTKTQHYCDWSIQQQPLQG